MQRPSEGGQSSSTTPPPITIKEYQELFKEEEGLTEEEWSELDVYITYLRKHLEDLSVEDQPEIQEDSLSMGSLFGRYRFSSKRLLTSELQEDKLNNDELEELWMDIQELAPMLGIDRRSILQFIDPAFDVGTSLSFSELLNGITTTILSEGPPIRLLRREYVAPVSQGQIDVPKTIKKRAQGQKLVLSSKADITMDTLPALLFVKFHQQLLSDLNQLLRDIKQETDVENASFYLIRRIKHCKANHQTVLSHPLYGRFLGEALRFDFGKVETLEKARRQATTSLPFQDVIDLWRAYQTGRLPTPDVEDLRKGYSLKPASKLYELWVLEKLVRVLEELTGLEINFSSKVSGGTILFGEELKLLYNEIPSGKRKIKGRLRRLRPDFVLSIPSKQKILFIADAKYRSHEGATNKSNLRQMLSYLFTYGWTHPKGENNLLLLYIGTKRTKTCTSEEVVRLTPPRATISSLRLRPSKHGTICYSQLYSEIEKILRRKAPNMLS